MHHKKLAAISIALLAVASACSSGGSSPPGIARTTSATPSSPVHTSLTTADINGGPAFVTSSGFFVYTSSADSKDVSNCTGECLAVWPPFAPTSSALAAPFSSFKRADDGALQMTLSGLPLYTYSKDRAGEANGDGFEGFQLARPVGSTATAGATSAATSSATNAPTALPSPEPTGAHTASPY